MTRPSGFRDALRWAVPLALVVALTGCAAPATGAAGPTAVSGAETAMRSATTADPTTGAPSGPTSSVAPPRSAAAAAAAEKNHALAAAEAQRLHDLAARPPGAVTIDHQPPKLPGSAMGTPGSGSLIDVVTFWAVPLSQQQSDAWIAAHAPAGLVGGFGSPGVGGPASADVVTGTGFSAPNAAAWKQATLQESVAVVDAHHTVWRVEGEAIWLDPTPVRIQATGPTLRVTVTGGCPGTDRGSEGVTNKGRELDTALLPAGHPTAVLVCRYAGANGKPFSLLASKPMTAPSAAELSTRVRAISFAHDASNPLHSCPMDDGAAAVIAFSFAGRSDVDLWVRTNGCSSISNGWIVADGNPLA